MPPLVMPASWATRSMVTASKPSLARTLRVASSRERVRKSCRISLRLGRAMLSEPPFSKMNRGSLNNRIVGGCQDAAARADEEGQGAVHRAKVGAVEKIRYRSLILPNFSLNSFSMFSSSRSLASKRRLGFLGGC